MKINKFIMSVGIISALTFLPSCSDDDKDTPDVGNNDFSELEKPAMADEAVKYDVTTPGSDISSIELTESGQYIITRSGAYFYSAQSTDSRLATKARHALGHSRAADPNYICGSYIKVGENEYILDGYGSVVITGSSNNGIELIISPEDGDPFTVGAQQDTALFDTSEETIALCRSWNPTQIRMRVLLNGKVMADESGAYKDYNKVMERIARKLASYNPDEYDDDDFIFDDALANEVIFTRSGSYVVFFDDDTLTPRIWRWSDRKNMQLQYSFYLDGFDYPEYTGYVTAGFNGHSVVLYEKQVESDYEDGDAMTVAYETWITATEKI